MLKLNGLRIKFEVAPSPVFPPSAHGPLHLQFRLTISETILLDYYSFK